MPHCPRCRSARVKKDGPRPAGRQRFRCHTCRRTFTTRTYTPFAQHRWPTEVILTAVRWYFGYRLSAADVRDLLAERHIDVSARTILSWAHKKFGPLLRRAAHRSIRSAPGHRWWCDVTYTSGSVAGGHTCSGLSTKEARYQLIINTPTTIITFLLVALLQNTQKRGEEALQHKLDAVADGLADSAALRRPHTEESSLAAD